jgi:hypothetical protein
MYLSRLAAGVPSGSPPTAAGASDSSNSGSLAADLNFQVIYVEN